MPEYSPLTSALAPGFVTLDTPCPLRHRRLMSFHGGFFLGLCAALVGSLPGALGCARSDDPSFLPIDQLCPELASDICGARNGGCCAAVDPLQCEQAEQASCSAELALLSSEPSLHYDSVAAAAQHERVRASLGACGSKPVLASFFQGGLSPGAACERSSQCTSGNCSVDGHVCVDPVAVPLCAAP